MGTVIPGTETYQPPYELPDPLEQGDDLWVILEDFINRIATHSHDGGDSKKISLNIEKDVALYEVNTDFTWNVYNNGRYRAQINLGVVPDFDLNLRSYFASEDSGVTYNEFYPTIERISNKSFYLYTNTDAITNIKIVSL